MTVYAVAQLTIRDQTGYERYVERFFDVLRRFDGRILAADESPLVLEGTWRGDRVVLLSFESIDAFRTWAYSEEYVAISKDGAAVTSSTVLLVHGVDGSRERMTARPRARELKRATDYIHENLSDPLTLADLARVARCSPWHLAREFRRVMGVPPHQYVVRARVEEARRLLRTGRLGVAEVADSVGFASQSHLSRHMRRLFGVTPSTYARDPTAMPPDRR
jgi:AraC-like DNA-binding protein/uncharacterized protein (DUF1330 family)